MIWALVLLGVLTAAPAFAAGPLTADGFRKAVEKKVAPTFGTIGTGKWKALCVCNPTEQVGALESFNGIPNLGLTCTVPTFAVDGTYTIGSACYDWSPLTK